MKSSRSTKSEIRKDAIDLLWKQKKNKNEAYSILIAQHLNHEKVLEVLSDLPDSKRKKQYKIHETILISFFVVLFIYQLSDSTIGAGIMFLLLIYSLVTHRIGVYLYISVYAFLISAVGIFMMMYQGTTMNLSQLLFVIVPISVAAYSIWLEKKLCPKPKVEKQLYQNAKGQSKYKINVEFAE